MHWFWYQILSFRPSWRTSCISLLRNVIGYRVSTCCVTGQTGLAGSLVALPRTCEMSTAGKESSPSSLPLWTHHWIRWVWSHIKWVWSLVIWVWSLVKWVCACDIMCLHSTLQLPKFYPSIMNHVLALYHLVAPSSLVLPLSLLSHPWQSPPSLRHMDSLSLNVRTCLPLIDIHADSPSLPLPLSPSLPPSLPPSLSPSLPHSLPPPPLPPSPQSSLPYHTSALFASALETATLFYRTEHNLTSLPSLSDTLTAMGRKVYS